METNRRKFFQTLGAGVASLSLYPALTLNADASDLVKGSSEDGQVLFIGDDIAITDTTYGKVKGFILRGIYHFLGIPYGADTSDENRFMPPRKPKPFDGIFPAVWWGNSAPQNMENRYADPYSAFADHWNYDDVSEDCLRLNVWTPGYGDGKKRPVIVWLHGGGFTNGNGIEQDGYNGENLSRYGDIVFCSLNHRLGPLGFTDLAGVGGDKYAVSGNVGMLDIVAALEWIRDNIGNFGGDPGNVTIIGQSGGGAKVCILAAMPSAKGLFHKAVVLSGATTKTGEKEYAEKLGAAVLKEAGLAKAQIDKLQQMPWKEYYAIATRASENLSKGPRTLDSIMRRGFNPVVDGTCIPRHPFYPKPVATASNVPMIICSTVNELAPSRTDAALEEITMDQVKEKLKTGYRYFAGLGDEAHAVVDAYAKAFPNKKPVEIWSMVVSNRLTTIELADMKSKQPPPVYLAWFGWQPPLFDNRMRAFHCLDICFWFYNTDRMLTHTGGGRRPRKLSEKMAGALLNFMRTGNPDGGGLPQWPRYTSENGETMMLNDIPEVKNDPDREARKSLPIT